VSADVSRDTRWSSKISAELRYPTENLMAAALKAADKVIGVIEIINKKGSRQFCKEDRAMLEMLAGQLALDVAYVTLVSESLRVARHRTTQMKLAMVLNSSLKQREVRQQAIEAVASLLDAEVGSLLRWTRRPKTSFSR